MLPICSFAGLASIPDQVGGQHLIILLLVLMCLDFGVIDILAASGLSQFYSLDFVVVVVDWWQSLP